MRALLSGFADGCGRQHWQVGGSTNFAIAASRMGARCAIYGHVAEDDPGRFCGRVLEEEGVAMVPMRPELAVDDQEASTSASDTSDSGPSDEVLESLAAMGLAGGVEETLLCYVLVGASGGHSFVSRFDFNPSAVYAAGGRGVLPAEELRPLLAEASALFVNGYAFDELPGAAIMRACDLAEEQDNKCMLFFDPGPRASHLLALANDADDQAADSLASSVRRDEADATRALLARADVLLLTEEEARDVSGHADAESAAASLLLEGRGASRWCVVKRGSRGAMLARLAPGGPPGVVELTCAAGFSVAVADTVGCGDSFAGALCAAYLAGASPAASLALANATGAATAGSKGAGRNVGRRDAVERLLTARAAGKDGAQAEDREAAKAALALLAASEPAAAAVGSVA